MSMCLQGIAHVHAVSPACVHNGQFMTADV